MSLKPKNMESSQIIYDLNQLSIDRFYKKDHQIASLSFDPMSLRATTSNNSLILLIF